MNGVANANRGRATCSRCGYAWVATTATPLCPVCGAPAGPGAPLPTIRLHGVGRLHRVVGFSTAIVIVLVLLGTVSTMARTTAGTARQTVVVQPSSTNSVVLGTPGVPAAPPTTVSTVTSGGRSSTPSVNAPTPFTPTTVSAGSGEDEYQAAVQEIAAGQLGAAYKSLEASILLDPTRTDALARMYDVNSRLRPPIHVVSDVTSWRATAKAADGWNSQINFDETGWASPVPGTVDSAVPKLDDTQASFIWAPNSSGSGADAYFRRVVELETVPYSAKIQMNVDDKYELYVNGTKVGEDQRPDGWSQIENYDVSASLRPGKNLVAIFGHNVAGNYSFTFSMRVDQVPPMNPEVGKALNTFPTPTQTSTATPTSTSTPTDTPTSTATPDVRPLVSRLDAAWAKSDWPTTISTLQQLRRIAPDSKDYRDKLYSASFAYGKTLLGKGDKAGAAAQFKQADETDPSRGEAKAQLLALTPTSTPAPPSPTPLVCESRFGDFCLVSTASQNDGYFAYVTGTVINMGDRKYGYVQVEITLLDGSGATVGSTLSNVNNLGPGQTWKFKAAVFENATRTYRVENITGF